MTNRQSQRKGKGGEQEVAALLSSLLHVDVVRGASPYLPGITNPDVYGIQGLHIEVKRTQRLNLCAALRQARRDACGALPLILHRRNREGWVASVHLEDIPLLATCIASLSAHLPTPHPERHSGN